MSLTIKDIARLSETNATAVSFVLNGKADKQVSASVQKAIRQVIRRHGYRRSAAAAGLRLQRSFQVAVCMVGAMSDYPLIGAASHHEMVNQGAQRLHDAGYGITLVQLEGLGEEQVRQLERIEADGLIFLDIKRSGFGKLLRQVAQMKRPMVAIDSSIVRDVPCSQMSFDREQSFRQATDHLLDRGLKKVAMLDIDIPGATTPLKLRGYEQAMHARGLTPYVYTMARPSVRGAVEAAAQMVAETPGLEGVILTDNQMAPAVQMALADRDLALLGFGDGGSAQLCEPVLTYMRLPVVPMVDAAIKDLLTAIEQPGEHSPRTQRFLCELVEPTA